MDDQIDRRSVLKAMGVGIGAGGLGSVAGLPDVASASECSTHSKIDVTSVDASSYPDIEMQVQMQTEAADAGLDGSRFTVREEGTVRSLDCFNKLDEEEGEGAGKVDIVFVFDDSWSMSGPLSTLRNNAADFARQIEEAGLDGRYAMITLYHTESRPWDDGNSNLEIDQRFVSDGDAFEEGISHLEVEGGTQEPNLDGIHFAATELDWRDGAQKVIVNACDESNGNSNVTDKSTVTSKLQEENMTVYAIVNPGDSDIRSRDLPELTGGELVDISDRSFPNILDDIERDITRGQYRLCYETPLSCSEEPHPVDVCVDEPDLGRIAASGEYDTPEPGSERCNQPPVPEVGSPDSPTDPEEAEGAAETEVTAVAGESVELDATDSFDPDGPNEGINCVWTLPDGSTMDGVVVEHTFDSPGEESVTLAITDVEGATTETEVAVDVAERVGMDVTPTRPIDAVDCSGEVAARSRPQVGAGRAPDSVPADAPADPGRGSGGSGPGAAPGADGESPGAADGHDGRGRVGPSPGRAPVGGGGICDIPVLVQPADGIDPYHDIDVGSLRFGDADVVEGGGGAEPLHEGGHPASETSFAGSNTALLVHFAAEETGITADTEQVKLVAETDGASLASTDGSTTVVASTELDR